VTHKSRNIDNFSYKFQDVWLTVEELQKLINELDSNKEIIWNSENLVKEDFEYLYEKVKEYSVVQSKLVNKS
jgi:Zn-finger nucleic acid-binding protein